MRLVRNIRADATVLLLLTGAVPLIVMLGLFCGLARLDMREVLIANRLKMSDQIARQIEDVIENAVLDMEYMKSDPSLVAADISPERRKAELLRVQGTRFDGLALCDEQGFIVSSTAKVEVQREYTPWFQRCRDENRILASQPMRQERTGSDNLFISVYVPVPKSPDNLVRVIRAQLPFDRVWNILDRSHREEGSEFYLVDSQGDVIYSRDRSQVFQKFQSLYPPIDPNASSGDVQHEGKDLVFVGHRVVPRYKLAQTPDWRLVWVENREAHLSVLARTRSWLGLSALASIVLSLTLGVLLGGVVTKPIVTAANAALQAAKGDMNVRLAPMATQELNSLAQSFNHMLEKISQHQSVLEAQVVERTRQWEAANGELKKTVAQLQQSQKMEGVGVLAGGIAHDFNNLLTVITGNLGLAQKRASGKAREGLQEIEASQTYSEEWLSTQKGHLDEIRTCLRAAQTAGDRAAGVVRHLLGFSRKGERSVKSHDLNDLVNEIQEILVRTFDRRIEIISQCDPEPCQTEGDANQIQQVLMNLCINAKDALEGRGKITLRTGRRTVGEEGRVRGGITPPAGNYVCISVSDNGTGIPANILAHIFEPFFTTKAPNKGSGLGLAMCSGIAKEHGGWIECDSAPGAGSTFTVYLPQANAVPEAETASGEPAEKVEEEAPVQATVLLADDEPSVRMIAETILTRSGFTVVTANDGSEAVRLIRLEPRRFDVAILDGAMPVMSGQEAFQILDREIPDLPVVICSGNFGEGNEFETERGRRPEAFVTKPYAFDHFIREVTHLVKTRRAA